MNYDVIECGKVTDRQLVRSLRSARCPACGGPKDAGKTFCGLDYFNLTQATRKSLYRLIGDGYREAVLCAMAQLKSTMMILPVES